MPSSEVRARMVEQQIAARGITDPRVLEALQPHRAIGTSIVAFWLGPEAGTSATWSEHHDINEMRLAACLVPDGLLALVP